MANLKLNDLATEFLAVVLADFRSRGLQVDHLSEEYEGPSISSLEMQFGGDSGHSKVDFYLALQDLEEGEFIHTGPTVPHENTPGSDLFVLGFYSKREYVCLTAKGYKVAQQSTKKPKTPTPSVKVMGTFHNSPIAIAGDTVNQATTISNIKNDSEVIERLAKLLSEHDPSSGEKERSEIADLVDSAKAGDKPKAQSIFQRLYSGAKENIRAAAWAVIVEVIKAHLGS